MLPPAQRRNASVRGGDCHRDARAVHEAVQLGRRSCGANRRGNEGIFTTGRNVTALSSAPPPNSPSNGEVEGPDDHAGWAPRAHTVPRRPRRQTKGASRPPPTIVRRQYHLRLSLRSSQVSAETVTDVNECCQKKYGIGNKNDRDAQVGVRY